MGFTVTRNDDGYFAEQDDEKFSTADRSEMIQHLVERGNHPVDVHEFVRFADEKWLREHPDEPDEGALFRIGKNWKEEAYSAMTVTRTALWSASANGLSRRQEIRDAVVERGFPAVEVDARLDEIDQAMADDRAHDRMSLGHTVVIRSGDGYRIRSIGEYDWWPRQSAVSRDRAIPKLRERHGIFLASTGNMTNEAKAESTRWNEENIQKLLERADQEAASGASP